jgi:RNA polymerase sigma-70 factor, ECF subfamily
MEWLTPETERDLVARAQNDDDGAFGELYDYYLPRLYGYVHRRVGHAQAAEDLVSQVFLNVVAALPGFRSEKGSFGAWLYHIATNVIIDHYRSPRHLATPLELETAEAVVDERPGPESAAELSLAREKLAEIWKRLAPADQEVLHLRFYGELSQQEIGDVLNCSASHAGVRIHRALKKAAKISEKI